VTWYEAQALCERQGKRLCSEEEWEKVCKGPSNFRYPYGNEWDPDRCNTEDADGVDRQVDLIGTWTACTGEYGAFDLSGNVKEWTDSKWSAGFANYVVRGGSSTRPDWAVRCANRESHTPNTSNSQIGFRCCLDK